MAATVPGTSSSIPADLKGEAGSGLATVQAEQAPVLLSPSLKQEIQNIVSRHAANKTSLTPTEFLDFLHQEQQVNSRRYSLTLDIRSSVRGQR